MQDLNTEISQMTEPIHTRTSAGTSSLDADSYRAGQGRGGWQGD